MLDIAQYFPITNPTLIFFVVLLIILLAPVIMGKLRIPHIIGMVLAGVLIGQYGLNILVRDESFELFGKVGLYYIMFLASLEMNVEGIRKDSRQMIVFGLLTFALPFVMTYIMSRQLLGYSSQASFLLGCVMSSNTLIAYPIVSRYGLQRKKCVGLSVGSSMLSLLLSLVVLAAIVAAHSTGGGMGFWLWFACKFAAYCALLIMVVPRLTRWFLRRYSDAVMQFIFVLCMLFLSAALSEMVGVEGIFGAFMAGLILNRYIPHVSPLMNRIEFIGNALFIPYFLIGVGMLINVRLLFSGEGILWVVVAIVFFGTFGKAVAAYLSSWLFRLPLSAGNMMFGLTSAHAAGAIAMVMVGMKMEVAPGQYLVDDKMLNGIVIMILFTCVISTLVTERAAQQITMRDKDLPTEQEEADDERILVPIKYPEYAIRLMSLALMVRNPKLGREIIGLNVVYDDEQMAANQARGRKLLDDVARYTAAADVRLTTQVRVAANIANGIKHAFKEFHASEIIIGMHAHREVSPKFWGSFHQSLFNGLNNQIIMARLLQPLTTIRLIHVAVPSRAQFEPGFYRWLERLARLSENLECRILFHGRGDTLSLINEYVSRRHRDVKASYTAMPHWNEMPRLSNSVADDHLFVVVVARKGTVSYKNAIERLPEELKNNFPDKNLMIVFPDQHGDSMDEMTFAQPQHTEDSSAYDVVLRWINKLRGKKKDNEI